MLLCGFFWRQRLSLVTVLGKATRNTPQNQHFLALMNRNNKKKTHTHKKKPPKETNPSKHPFLEALLAQLVKWKIRSSRKSALVWENPKKPLNCEAISWKEAIFLEKPFSTFVVKADREKKKKTVKLEERCRKLIGYDLLVSLLKAPKLYSHRIIAEICRAKGTRGKIFLNERKMRKPNSSFPMPLFCF